MRRRIFSIAIAALCSVFVSVWNARAQNTIQYVYDELGRLIAVVDPASDTATYTYDAVGNILSIGRHASTQVSIISFSPRSAAVGATVTIQGTGFSSTAGQDTVTFNGVAATISTATTTALVVTVPAGATSGPIAVSAPGGSAISGSSFAVVAAGGGAPTITSFSPANGAAGTTLTVTGTNFDATASNDRTKVNASFATVSSVNATTLTTTIPGAMGSGPISITTPTGTAVSATDFIVAPPGFTLADIEFATRLAVGATQAFSVTTANKIGLVTFVGTVGQKISVTGTHGLLGQVVGCDIWVGIVAPDNTTLVRGTCMEGSGFIDATTLPATGTYTIVIDPASTATGGVTLTLNNVIDATGTITANGDPVTTTTTTEGQNARLTFSGTAGQRVSLKGTNGMSGQIVGCDVNASILNPDLSVLAAPTCVESGTNGFIDVQTLPTTGTYTVVVDPVNVAKGSVTLQLYIVPADFSGSITPTTGGSSVTVTTIKPGQNGRLTFSGTAAHRVSLLGTNGMSGQVLNCDVNVSITNPDSTVLAPPTCMEVSGFIDVTTLPSTGTYTIVIDPVTFVTGSITLTLYDVPADPTTTITPGGNPVTVTTTTAGQNALVTFSGTAGRRVSLQGTNGMSGQVLNCDVNVSILNPDASVLAPATCMESSGFIDVKTLPSTGTYTILVDPVSIAKGSLTLTLYDVPADPTTTVSVGSGAQTLTTGTPGQNATATFSGTANQQVTVRLTSNGMGSTTVKLLKPDGTQLTSTTSSAVSFNLATQTLPTTGTYTISIDPSGTNVGSITVNVTNP